MPELEEELLEEELLDDEELDEARPEELELLDELLLEDELLAVPSGPLQAQRLSKLVSTTRRGRVVSRCMAGSCKVGI